MILIRCYYLVSFIGLISKYYEESIHTSLLSIQIDKYEILNISCVWCNKQWMHCRSWKDTGQKRVIVCCLFRSIHPTAHKCFCVTYLFNLFMFFKYMLYKLYIQLLKSISHCFHPNQSLALPWPVKQLVKNYSCNFSSFKFKLFPVVVYVQMYFKTNWLSHFRSAWHHTLKGKTVYLPKKENSTNLAFRSKEIFFDRCKQFLKLQISQFIHLTTNLHIYKVFYKTNFQGFIYNLQWLLSSAVR